MIQASGLTKVYRRGRRPAAFDLSFDVRPGSVTALLGPEGAGKTTALRLMLQLEHGLGVTLFDGRVYRRMRRPEREVGVLLATAHPGPGSPDRTARGHLRMLAAAIGVPARRADELLERAGLAGVADQRLRTFSVEMARRLGFAVALLGEPKALLLDAPAAGLPARALEWLHSFIQTFPEGGGSLLFTTRSPQEAAQLADRVVTLADGQQAADQLVSEFRRTRLHPEVAVRGPQMARLADLLTEQGADVRPEGGVGLAVSGLARTEIGELAYRNGIMLHELADRVVEQPSPLPARPMPARRAPAPTVQLRRMAAIVVGGRSALPSLRPPTSGRAAEASPTIELPPVLDPLPSAATDSVAEAPGFSSASRFAEAATAEPLSLAGALAVVIPQPPAPDIAIGAFDTAGSLAAAAASRQPALAIDGAAAPALPIHEAPLGLQEAPPAAHEAPPAVHEAPPATHEAPPRALPASFPEMPAPAFPAWITEAPVPGLTTPGAEPPTGTSALADTSPHAAPSPLNAPGPLTAAMPADDAESAATPSPAPLPPAHDPDPLAFGHDPQPLTGPDHWNG